jgi:hypothetical protein
MMAEMNWSLRDKPPAPAHLSRAQRKALASEVKNLSWQNRGVRWGVIIVIGWQFLSGAEAFVWTGRTLIFFELSIFLFLIPWLVFCVLPTNRRNALRVWAAHGLCVKCGYDLRGNESGQCPECGRVWTAHGLCTKCGCDLRQVDSDRCPECGEVRVGYETGSASTGDKTAGS